MLVTAVIYFWTGVFINYKIHYLQLIPPYLFLHIIEIALPYSSRHGYSRDTIVQVFLYRKDTIISHLSHIITANEKLFVVDEKIGSIKVTMYFNGNAAHVMIDA